MRIQEKIKGDMVEAMKNKDVAKLSILRYISAEFSRGLSKDINDDEALKILRKTIEKSKEMNNDFEVEVLSGYVPQMLSDDDVKRIVDNIIKENGITSGKEMGKIMGFIKQHEKSNLIDNKVVVGYIKEYKW